MEKLLNYFKRLVGYEDNYVPATHPPLVRMNAQTNLLNEDNKLSDIVHGWWQDARDKMHVYITGEEVDTPD
jgi:hypothetical protein